MAVSFGFLSSYPPTQCGLATFTAALQAEVAAAGHDTGVVRVLERPDARVGATVVQHMVHRQPDAVSAAVAALNAADFCTSPKDITLAWPRQLSIAPSGWHNDRFQTSGSLNESVPRDKGAAILAAL